MLTWTVIVTGTAVDAIPTHSNRNPGEDNSQHQSVDDGGNDQSNG